MCRTGGRRCDRRWGNVEKGRYNARRRVARNHQRAEQAVADGRDPGVYQALAATAEREAATFDGQLREHQDSHARPERAAAIDAEGAAEWRAGWSDAEKAAQSEYGSVLHYEINEALRTGAQLTPEQKRTVEGMDALLERAPQLESEYRVYRGISTLREGRAGFVGVDSAQWVAENAQPGQTISFPGFASTSLRPEVAHDFAGETEDFARSGVVFEITTRNGAYTGASPEDEVLFPRDSQFEVVSVDPPETLENGRVIQRVRLQDKGETRRMRMAQELRVGDRAHFQNMVGGGGGGTSGGGTANGGLSEVALKVMNVVTTVGIDLRRKIAVFLEDAPDTPREFAGKSPIDASRRR